MCGGGGVGNSAYFPINFSVEPETAPKNKAYLKNFY